MKTTYRYIVILLLSALHSLAVAGPLAPGKELSAVEYPRMPLPFGVGFWYFGQEQEYVVTGLEATSFGFQVPGFGADAIARIENRVDQVNLKADYWILPWLNVHGIVGTASGKAFAELDPVIQTMFGLTDFTVGYDALIYGGGVTLAVGYKNFFATVTSDYSWGDVDMKDGPGLVLNDPRGIETLVVTPKIGVHGEKGAIWAGAYLQFTRHTQTGTFFLPGPGPVPVDFAASVEDRTPWTPVVGGEYHFNDHWAITVECGFGTDRRQGLVGLTYRY